MTWLEIVGRPLISDKTISQRLVIGWAAGTLTSVAGVIASYAWDLPTGATVVCAFGVCLIVCAVLRVLGGSVR